MCGIRECLSLLQWMTKGKATKYDDQEEGPRPVMVGRDGKWGVDEKRGGEKEGMFGGGGGR